MSRRAVLLVGLAAGTAAFVLLGMHVTGSLADVRVYRAGGSAWWHGIPLYTKEFPSFLPFSYPPAAALLFSVLAAVPLPAAIGVLTAAGLVALAVTTSFGARVAPVFLVAALLLEPVRETLLFGQVNLVLMGLIAVDCLARRPSYPRGLLIGIAAVVKLTPAIFVLFFLVRKQYRAAATAAGTFVAGTALAFVVLPGDSVRYWTVSVFDADRVGGAAYATNQSLRGALHRLGITEDIVWPLLVPAVLVLAWFGARRAADPVIALLVVAAAGLLVSPVSWSHHWVWVVLALAAGLPRWPGVFFLVGQQFLPRGDDRELAWTWWQHLAGNSYLLVALAFLVWRVVCEQRVDERAGAGGRTVDAEGLGGRVGALPDEGQLVGEQVRVGGAELAGERAEPVPDPPLGRDGALVGR